MVVLLVPVLVPVLVLVISTSNSSRSGGGSIYFSFGTSIAVPSDVAHCFVRPPSL